MVQAAKFGFWNEVLRRENPPNTRVDRLREFWTQVTSEAPWDWLGWGAASGDGARKLLNQASANLALTRGAKSFFAARLVSPWLQPSGRLEATSFYDTHELKLTLERLVDFDRLNAGLLRFSVGAVNVRTGNFVYFDTTTHAIKPEHVMASGALPPGFPPIEIEGEHYWDGGLVSNTPLQWVVESEQRRDTLAFQVDLWSARGDFPRNMLDIITRGQPHRHRSDQAHPEATAPRRPPFWKSFPLT